MSVTTLVLAAAAAAGGAAAHLPDIELNARVRAREVRIEQQGEAHVRVWAEPSAGDDVKVDRNLPRGQRTYRNLDVKLHAEARLAEPPARAGRDNSQPGE